MAKKSVLIKLFNQQQKEVSDLKDRVMMLENRWLATQRIIKALYGLKEKKRLEEKKEQKKIICYN